MSTKKTNEQGHCLLGGSAKLRQEFIVNTYDRRFTPDERRRVRNSPFNLCAACVYDLMKKYGFTCDEACNDMEGQIRQLGVKW